MSFLNPYFLYFMIIPLFILSYFLFSSNKNLNKYFSKEILEKLIIKGDFLGNKGRIIIYFMSFIFMIIALARPVIFEKEQNISVQKNEVLMLIDISTSMLAKDVFPNRLTFAKNIALNFIRKLKNTNFGIVLFAKDAYLLSPITYDSQSIEYLLSNYETKTAEKSSTNIYNAIKQSVKLLEYNHDLILFTDGGDDKNIQKTLDFAKKHKLKIHVISIGLNDGIAINYNNELLKDKNNNIVISKRNDIYENLSISTNSIYIKEPYDGINGIKKLELQLNKTSKIINDMKYKDKQELFYYPLALSIFLLFIAMHSLPKKLLLLLFLLNNHELKAGIFDFYYIKKANEYKNLKDFNKSAYYFSKIDSNKALFNQANMKYFAKNYHEAIKIYEKLVIKNLKNKSDILFNIGNSYFKLKNYKKAKQAYLESLKLKNDKDVKNNLMLVNLLLNDINKKNSKNKKNKQKKKNNKGKNISKIQKNQKQMEQKEQNMDNESKKLQKKLNKKSPSIMPIPLNSTTKSIDENNW